LNSTERAGIYIHQISLTPAKNPAKKLLLSISAKITFKPLDHLAFGHSADYPPMSKCWYKLLLFNNVGPISTSSLQKALPSFRSYLSRLSMLSLPSWSSSL